MRHMLLLAVLVLFGAGVADAADGNPVPYRIIPLENYSVTVKNWSDESNPHYAIIGHPGEWDATFQATAVMGNNRPFKPEASMFNKEHLVVVSRVSDAPAPGQKVLVVKSLTLADGELVLTYSFIPPAQKSSYKVKNSLVLAVPVQYQDYGIRFIEELETPASIAAARELEEAKAAGRTKYPAAPGPQMPPNAPPPQGMQPRPLPPQQR